MRPLEVAEGMMTTYQSGVKITDQEGNPLAEIHSTRRKAKLSLAIGMMMLDKLLVVGEDTRMMLR
jgi:hypothetical protein